MAAIQRQVDKRTKPSGYRWIVLALIFVTYMLAAADRANIGIALPHIQTEFGIDNSQAGLIVSAFFLLYALGQVPAGLIISRSSVRIVTPVAMALTSLSTYFIGSAQTVLQLKLFRSLLGVSEAALPLAMLTTINRWFPPREKGTATGVFLAAAKFGAVVAPPLGAFIIATHGWRALFLVFAVPGVFLAAAWWLFVANTPRESRFVSSSEADLVEKSDGSEGDKQSEWRSFGVWDRLLKVDHGAPIETSRGVFSSWNVWGCGFGYMLMTGVVNVLLAWLPKYLGEVKGFPLLQVGMIASLPFIGGVLGNVMGGWLSDKVLGKRRKPTMIISAVATCVMMLAMIYAPNSALVVSLLLFFAGFLLNIGYSSFSVYSMGLTTPKTYPVAASLVNSTGQIGGALAPLIAGMLLDSYDWNMVFAFLAACSISALLFIALMIEPMPQEHGA